jgi:hypothetical protein
MAYNYSITYAGPTTWVAEDPITANKMNNLEAGVAMALDTAESKADVYEVQNRIDTATIPIINRMSTAEGNIRDIMNTLSSSTEWAEHGEEAYS